MRGFTLPRAGLLICAGLAMLSASCGSGTNDDLARLDSSPGPAAIAGDTGRNAPVLAEMEQGALTRDGIAADGLPPLPILELSLVPGPGEPRPLAVRLAQFLERELRDDGVTGPAG